MNQTGSIHSLISVGLKIKEAWIRQKKTFILEA